MLQAYCRNEDPRFSRMRKSILQYNDKENQLTMPSDGNLMKVHKL